MNNELIQIKGHEDFVASMAASPDGRWLASSGTDEYLRIWDTTNGKLVDEIHGCGPVSDLRFLADGVHLIGLDLCGMLAKWEFSNGHLCADLINSDEAGICMAVSNDETKAAFWMGRPERIIIQNTENRETLSEILFQTQGTVDAMAFLPDNRHLLLLHGGRLTRLDTETGRLFLLADIPYDFGCLATNHTGSHVAMSLFSDVAPDLFMIEARHLLEAQVEDEDDFLSDKSVFTSYENTSMTPPTAVAVSPNGERAAFFGDMGCSQFVLFDRASNTEHLLFTPGGMQVSNAVFLDNDRIAMSLNNASIVISPNVLATR